MQNHKLYWKATSLLRHWMNLTISVAIPTSSPNCPDIVPISANRSAWEDYRTVSFERTPVGIFRGRDAIRPIEMSGQRTHEQLTLNGDQ
jgi:hypothetical protein